MHNWTTFVDGRMHQVALQTPEDLAALAELDRKEWLALSMPVRGVRGDTRMLELMDTDRDGHIRPDEILGAISFLQQKGVDLAALFAPTDADRAALSDILDRQADLAKEPPSEADQKALADWEARGRDAAVAVLGDATAAAEAALASVEPTLDAFFTPPEDLPLVTDAPDVELPLHDHLNPKHLEAILAFDAACVVPLLGAREKLSRLDFKKIKALFAPYRAWVAAKPVAGADAKARLDDEERVLRYKLGLLEILENFVNMRRLYDRDSLAVFQTGTLRIDAREMTLCFAVANEAAHAALAEKSKCCILYLKLTRPAEKAERTVCAVVTAGTVGGLYVGRNGVFYDRDGRDWEAVVTRLVEAQTSLAEAFWEPWRKLGAGITDLVKKFFGDRQKIVSDATAAGKLPPVAKDAPASGGAAAASSVAAIGIGIGMLGTAAAAIAASVRGMTPWQFVGTVLAIIAVVSLPSVILTVFKLRQRDLGAILNAGGWAVNRPMRLSMRRARAFTKCPRTPALRIVLWTLCAALWFWAALLWLG